MHHRFVRIVKPILIMKIPTLLKLRFVEPVTFHYPVDQQTTTYLLCEQADYLGFDEQKGLHILRVFQQSRFYAFYVQDPYGDLEAIKQPLDA